MSDLNKKEFIKDFLSSSIIKEAIFDKNNVLFIMLGGSRGNLIQNENSDIDLIIYVDDYKNNYMCEYRLKYKGKYWIHWYYNNVKDITNVYKQNIYNTLYHISNRKVENIIYIKDEKYLPLIQFFGINKHIILRQMIPEFYNLNLKNYTRVSKLGVPLCRATYLSMIMWDYYNGVEPVTDYDYLNRIKKIRYELSDEDDAETSKRYEELKKEVLIMEQNNLKTNEFLLLVSNTYKTIYTKIENGEIVTEMILN